MRTLCDVCENAAAILFCAADEAALCRACDEKVHTCNKLASKHVRVRLADPTDVPRCDICENAPGIEEVLFYFILIFFYKIVHSDALYRSLMFVPSGGNLHVAFFYCEIDGSSLCLQCDMIVHVGGKRTHERYLLLRQRVEFPGNKPGRLEELGLQPLDQNGLRKDQNQSLQLKARDGLQNHRVPPVLMLDNNVDGQEKMDKKLIDLNTKPQRLNGPASSNQESGMDISSGNNHESARVVPVESFKREAEK